MVRDSFDFYLDHGFYGGCCSQARGSGLDFLFIWCPVTISFCLLLWVAVANLSSSWRGAQGVGQDPPAAPPTMVPDSRNWEGSLGGAWAEGGRGVVANPDRLQETPEAPWRRRPDCPGPLPARRVPGCLGCVYIEEVLSKWKGDYDKLERNHTYIQWLFPLREQGLNFYAKELTTYEIEEFKKTKEAIRRFLLAYKMMLEFFGIKLIDKTGNVARAVNWQERFQHLNESQHNYLRITRILKSLGELGYESFKSPLVKFILHEALVENTIPNIKQSALEYFVYTIRDRRERRKLLRFAQKHYMPSENFIWGPPRKEQSEGSKAQKMPPPLASSQNSQSSMHKKSKDSKNSSTAVHLNSKTVEEKKEPGLETDRPSPEPSNEAAKSGHTDKDSNAENSHSQPEKIATNSAELKENGSPSGKDEEGESHILDCDNPTDSSSQDEVLVQ
ncbi:PREDICTED: opioid growth factor receptor-like protein 1 [Dipodomys ordii]|uniref:Opioid growth factor receptor-like protein 1 n=1 Tax=Dipodomys ordii TaxID=10020 RepID=A0A1S3GJT8_DIPOR|nr:PREDICTED: opioid growth factor receptor-like protein 1 [Dipodomys ordii]